MSDSKTAALEKLNEILAKLDALTAIVTAARPVPPPRASGLTNGNGAVFPNYGNSKGQPIFGADLGSLEFYATGARRSIADPSKAQWSDKEKRLLSALEAEIARQSGGGSGPPDESPPMPEDAPF